MPPSTCLTIQALVRAFTRIRYNLRMQDPNPYQPPQASLGCDDHTSRRASEILSLFFGAISCASVACAMAAASSDWRSVALLTAILSTASGFVGGSAAIFSLWRKKSKNLAPAVGLALCLWSQSYALLLLIVSLVGLEEGL